MLDFFRERAKGWFAWFMLLFIGVPFAFWGVNQYFTPSGTNEVAQVNETGITDRQYQSAYQQARMRLQAQLGSNFDPAMFNEKFLKQRVIEQLINEQVLFDAAAKAGYRVGDELVGAQIRAIPEFQSAKNFDKALYERLLRSQGQSPQMFENSLRRSMLIGQLRETIVGSAFVTPRELDVAEKLENQKRTIGYVVVPLGRFPVDDGITDDQIQRYYDSHKDRFAVPERVQIEYIELKLDDLAGQIAVDDARLKNAYEERADEFVTEEERRASHILVAVDRNATAQEKDAARHKAENLLERIRKGEDFAALAKAHSDDPGSAEKGGDLGFFGHGIMEKPFEEAAFKLKEGEVSDIVETAFGFHIIKLTGIRPAHGKSFDEVRGTIERDLKRELAQEQFYEKSETLTNLAFENPDTLAVAAEETGLAVHTSDWFDRSTGIGLAGDPRIRQTAFSDDVLVDRLNSEPVELADDHFVILRVKDRQPATTRPLAEVHKRIVKQLQRDRAREKAREVSEQIKLQLEKGGKPADIADKYQLSWVAGKTVSRDTTSINSAIVKAAFHMPHPAGQAPVSVVELNSGGYAVVRLAAIVETEPARGDDKGRQELRSHWVRAIGSSEFGLLLENIKSKAKIIRHEDKL